MQPRLSLTEGQLGSFAYRPRSSTRVTWFFHHQLSDLRLPHNPRIVRPYRPSFRSSSIFYNLVRTRVRPFLNSSPLPFSSVSLERSLVPCMQESTSSMRCLRTCLHRMHFAQTIIQGGVYRPNPAADWPERLVAQPPRASLIGGPQSFSHDEPRWSALK